MCNQLSKVDNSELEKEIRFPKLRDRRKIIAC